MQQEIVNLSTGDLTLHPKIEGFPALSSDQFKVLHASIEKKGILEPLLCTPDYEVYSGRARLRVALSLGLPTVPVVVREEKDVLGFMIESRIARGQLTKSGIVLVLFEQHPALALKPNQGGRPTRQKIPVIKSPVSGQAISSFTQLSERYRVPREYFFHLTEMFQEATAEEWLELRRLILEEEASIPRQYAGFKTGRPAGSKRGAVIYGWVNEQGILEGIFPRSFASILQGFSSWNDAIDTRAKVEIEKQWGELLDAAPPELQRIAKRKAAQS